MSLYSNAFSAVAVTAQQDLFEITAPAGGVVIIHRIIISQTTEVADAQEEQLLLLLKRGATTTGSGGTTIAQSAGMGMEPNGPAFPGVVKVNNTTKASVGTIVTLHAEAWNVRGTYEYLPPPELRPILSPSAAAARLTVELATTPADSVTINGVINFEYIGL